MGLLDNRFSFQFPVTSLAQVRGWPSNAAHEWLMT